MAIGDFGNSNYSDKQNSKDLTYYSRLKFRTADNSKSLSFSFWGGLVKFEINAVDTNNGFKGTTLEYINLSPNKAKLLACMLEELKEYVKNTETIDPEKAYGVVSGLGNEQPFIAFSCMDDENKTLCLTIGKINSSGQIISSNKFLFDNSANFMYGLEWTNLSDMNLEKVVFNHIDLEMITDMLKDFGSHMNGAIAYSTLDLARYEYAKVNQKFDSIFDKLGIERIQSSRYNSGNSGSNSFLNGLASKNSSTLQSFDNLEDMLND